MPKKKKLQKSKLPKDSLTHIQYFYALGGLLIVAAIAGAVFLPHNDAQVLSSRDESVDAGSINLMRPTGASEKKLFIEANGGQGIGTGAGEMPANLSESSPF